MFHFVYNSPQFLCEECWWIKSSESKKLNAAGPISKVEIREGEKKERQENNIQCTEQMETH